MIASRIGPIPLPHEHGAWAILYTPLILVLAVLRPFQLVPAALLVTAVTGAFLAQNVASRLIRKRAQEHAGFWLATYLFLTAAGGLPLVVIYERVHLLPIGAAGLAFFAFHTYLGGRPSGGRLVRTEEAELLSVAIMALSAPAAYITVRGSIDWLAAGIWAGSILFFASSILYVKMLLKAAKLRTARPPVALKSARVPVLYYHAFLLTVLLAVASALEAPTGLWLVIAFTPILSRAFIGAATLSPAAPRLRAVGMLEAVYSVWFLCWAGAALSALRGSPFFNAL